VNRRSVLGIGLTAVAVFGCCGIYLYVSDNHACISSFGPCLDSTFAPLALWLGSGALVVGSAAVVFWSVWAVASLVRRQISSLK